MFLVYTHVLGKPINDIVSSDLLKVKKNSKTPACYMNSNNEQLKGDMHINLSLRRNVPDRLKSASCWFHEIDFESNISLTNPLKRRPYV